MLTEGVRIIQRNFSSSCAQDYGNGFWDSSEQPSLRKETCINPKHF